MKDSPFRTSLDGRTRLLLQGANELIEVRVVDVRHRPVGRTFAHPMSHVESSNRPSVRRGDRLRRLRRHEHIDRVLAARVHERGDGMASQVVQPSPGEWVSSLGEIRNGW